ncbi:hypothetical protein TNCV_4339751 [Trichonephila clavipes]|nr:hypothetical protein TNCV_4339751 [Trichonephila clavipes]
MEKDIVWKNGDTGTNSKVNCDNGSDDSFSKHDTDRVVMVGDFISKVRERDIDIVRYLDLGVILQPVSWEVCDVAFSFSFPGGEWKSANWLNGKSWIMLKRRSFVVDERLPRDGEKSSMFAMRDRFLIGCWA